MMIFPKSWDMDSFFGQFFRFLHFFLHSLKLTYLLKVGGWETIRLPFGAFKPIFRCKALVLGRVVLETDLADWRTVQGKFVQVCQANLQLEKPITEAVRVKSSTVHENVEAFLGDEKLPNFLVDY